MAKESLDPAVERLLKDRRTAAEDYWFPAESRRDDDDDEHKSRWERFKGWCERNKVYIAAAILITVGVMTALALYSSETPPPKVPPSDWKEKSGLERLE